MASKSLKLVSSSEISIIFTGNQKYITQSVGFSEKESKQRETAKAAAPAPKLQKSKDASTKKTSEDSKKHVEKPRGFFSKCEFSVAYHFYHCCLLTLTKHKKEWNVCLFWHSFLICTAEKTQKCLEKVPFKVLKFPILLFSSVWILLFVLFLPGRRSSLLLHLGHCFRLLWRRHPDPWNRPALQGLFAHRKRPDANVAIVLQQRPDCLRTGLPRISVSLSLFRSSDSSDSCSEQIKPHVAPIQAKTRTQWKQFVKTDLGGKIEKTFYQVHSWIVEKFVQLQKFVKQQVCFSLNPSKISVIFRATPSLPGGRKTAKRHSDRTSMDSSSDSKWCSKWSATWPPTSSRCSPTFLPASRPSPSPGPREDSTQPWTPWITNSCPLSLDPFSLSATTDIYRIR